MQAEQILSFGPYRFDLASARLWRGKHEVRLTGKAFAVLRHLVTHAGELVTKDALFQAVWPETVVSDAALISCIKELRQALRDTARERRYIETVHRRGFRFIGKVVSDQLSVVSGGELSGVRGPASEVKNSYSAFSNPQSAINLVGRGAELTQLHDWLAKALSGERQVVFVAGEAGIGKTTLINAFRQRLETGDWRLVPSSQAPSLKPLASPVSFAHGQCIEHYGAGEAYLPIFEALGRLCRETGGEQLIAVLQQHAPTWLVQMPALLSAEELEGLQRKTTGATRERMLRELAEALEVITAKRPLVLVLEDLHWADVSTLDWLAFVARRREPARLLVIGTYRPEDVLARGHPLRVVKQELQTHGYCAELLLDFLSEEAVANYLAQRFCAPSPALAGEGRGEGLSQVTLRKLARLIHRRTDGNPLFMINVVNDLIARGVLVQSESRWELRETIEEMVGAVPESLQQLIAQQIERLRPETQRLLEVASVAGVEFSAATVAAGLEMEVDVVEEQCEELVRGEHFLWASGTAQWPDGTVAARYSFRHALYQDVLYHRLTARRRQRVHQQIGEREEAGYGKQPGEVAAELALHFERGRDYHKAVRYLQYAGENALRRCAHQEALSLFTKGLELLNTLPQTHERNLQELILQNLLGAALAVTEGWAAPAVEKAYSRALELCQQSGETPQLFAVLEGLFAFALVRAELSTALELGEQCVTVAQSMQTPQALLWAYHALGETLFYLGEFASAQEHFVQGFALYDSQKHNPYVLLAQVDPGVVCLSWIAQGLWYLGYPDQAQRKIHEAFRLAEKLSHPFSCAYVLSMAGELHQFCQETQLTQERADALVTLSTEQGFSLSVAEGIFLQGWALTRRGYGEEGIPRMRRGVADWQATGANIGCPYQMALLAEAYGEMGQVEEGLNVLAKAFALVDKTEERWYEAELYRLKGELTLQEANQKAKACPELRRRGKTQKTKALNPKSQIPDPQSEAEACFLKAIDIARTQQARSWELRAATSLARLWQQQGKQKQAHKLLSEIYGWFTEGFDTKDLQEAKALIEELSH